jgi:predicted phage terminase large subunit-like protein
VTNSLAASVASLPEPQRRSLIESLSDAEAGLLLYDWGFWARPDQIPPDGPWRNWLILSGRGWGKTRTGGEFVRAEVERLGPNARIAIIGQTVADVRKVMMEGESGLLACYPPDRQPEYVPTKGEVYFPNGALGLTYSGDSPGQLRGPQHHAYWADELAKWQYPTEAWDNLEFGLRLGENPRGVITTTPQPIKVIRELMKDALTRTTRGSTFDNAGNLPPAVLQRFRDKYEGTRIGRQELYGEVLDDVPGALWTRKLIEDARLPSHPLPDFARVVVAIDPAVTSGEDADETGIVVCGRGVDGRGYVLADLSCRLSPDGWAKRAVNAYHEFRADRIVAEVNNGGDLVERVIRTVDRNVSFKAVHASRGKRVRAEPVAALYEQARVSHCGAFDALEDQMCMFVPDQFDGSPDRVDSLVWAISDLMLEGKQVNIRVL